MDDQNPGLDSASEGAEDLELGDVNTTEKLDSQDSGGDPLDDIKDEKVRNEMKKLRAIGRREEKREKTVESNPQPKTAEFLTKVDFYKSNERKAIVEITKDPEVKAVWDKVVPFYTPRRGKDTAEDIIEDLKDALTLYRARNPVVETDNSKNELTASTVVKQGGGSETKSPPEIKLPNYKSSSKPENWYSKSTS